MQDKQADAGKTALPSDEGKMPCEMHGVESMLAAKDTSADMFGKSLEDKHTDTGKTALSRCEGKVPSEMHAESMLAAKDTSVDIWGKSVEYIGELYQKHVLGVPHARGRRQ